jgi:hypothetical protein
MTQKVPLGLPWNLRHDYPALLALFSDPDKLPKTFDAWLKHAKTLEKRLEAAGIQVDHETGNAAVPDLPAATASSYCSLARRGMASSTPRLTGASSPRVSRAQVLKKPSFKAMRVVDAKLSTERT